MVCLKQSRPIIFVPMLPGACNSKGYLKAGPCRYHGECDYLPTQNEVSGYPVLRTRAFCVPTSHRKSRESLCMMSCRLALDSQVLAGLQSPVASSGQNLLWVDLQSQLTHEFPTAVMNKDAIASSSCLLACATTQHDAFHTLGVPHILLSSPWLSEIAIWKFLCISFHIQPEQLPTFWPWFCPSLSWQADLFCDSIIQIGLLPDKPSSLALMF